MKTTKWALLSLAAGLISGSVLAAPVTVVNPFFNLEFRGPNSLGWTEGQFVRFGANFVSPQLTNSNPIDWQAGTVGWATLDADPSISRRIWADPLPVAQNFAQRILTDNAALYRGGWTVHFRNEVGTVNQVDLPVYLDPNAQHAPKVENITLSGTGVQPTFTWTPPAGTTVNGYRVNIFDKDLALAGKGSNIVSRNFEPNVTSYTVDPAHFSVQGYEFKVGKAYVIEISIIQTKDGLANNLSNENVQAIARSYADFTPTEGSGPIVNLPVVLANGSYLFNMSVVPGQTYFIDPEVAVGYDYAIGAGNPNFLSVDLPDNIGDGLYDIYGFDAADQLVLLADDWNGANVFSFGADGVDRFRVLGIETSAGLDPANTTAFITGLTFTGAGQFTGTQTPITVNVDGTVPEPSGLALAGLGLLGLLHRRRTR